jgi:hypothetical protein
VFGQILSILSPAIEILSLVKEGPDERLDRRYGNARDGVVRSLRRIYFTPDGVRNVLVELANGRTPSSSQIEDALGGFNDAEWRVDRELNRLDFSYLQDVRELSLEASEHLHQLRYAKIDIRRQIQRELNEPLTRGLLVDPAVAQDLLVKVNELNALIMSLEREHNHRARGR